MDCEIFLSISHCLVSLCKNRIMLSVVGGQLGNRGRAEGGGKTHRYCAACAICDRALVNDIYRFRAPARGYRGRPGYMKITKYSNRTQSAAITWAITVLCPKLNRTRTHRSGSRCNSCGSCPVKTLAILLLLVLCFHLITTCTIKALLPSHFLSVPVRALCTSRPR